ncbi:unnamed protein product [Cuscuta europaea]|uniref:Uncharacterized protein n=1 Tax=Cuscuta europaea TaxID=41803 RepID=A0A9P0YJH4_CUSEU|nr:unnamed protein product [Cuscuta europaea]
MIHLEAIPIHSSSLTLTRRPVLLPGLKRKRHPHILSFCKKSTDSVPEGDSRQQELHARIVMLQTQKVRLTEFLDERAAYLTQFAEEANAGIDQIGENALKVLDQASARIMENIENQMQDFEESEGVDRQEIEENESS